MPSGLAQPHKYQLDLTLDSPELIRLRNNFVPGLEHTEYDPDAQGLRPLRVSSALVALYSALLWARWCWVLTFF